MPLVTFASGAQRVVSPDLAGRVRGLDPFGNLVVPLWDEPDCPHLVPLTWCCYASGKGSVNSPTGVCCRACYGPVDARYGGTTAVVDLVSP